MSTRAVTYDRIERCTTAVEACHKAAFDGRTESVPGKAKIFDEGKSGEEVIKERQALGGSILTEPRSDSPTAESDISPTVVRQ